ncbi:MAG TPA: ATP-binding protein, partial [Burkholderiales bacterium]|nr:ATP-binding protein [Burkholderiales bacterium]
MAAAKPSHSRPEMENLAYRESLLAEHPIITRGYTIATPMIEACYQVFRERVWLRRRGTVLYADTCTGKTTCSEAVEALLCMEFPNIYLASVDAQKSLGIRSFLKDLIDACGLALSGRETAMAMGEILLMGVQTECDKRKGNHFVLIIDEMQNLQEDEFTQLATLGNRLHRRHISMTTLGFAQPDITHLMKGFLASRKRNLVARFLAEQIIFEGCQ